MASIYIEGSTNRYIQNIAENTKEIASELQKLNKNNKYKLESQQLRQQRDEAIDYINEKTNHKSIEGFTGMDALKVKSILEKEG